MILGKDRNVEDTISIVKNILSSAGLNLVEDKLINPGTGIWSVHLKDKDSSFYTNGKGSTKDNALASAYCEYLERFISGFFYYDFYLDKDSSSKIISSDELISHDDILTSELINFYFPDGIDLDLVKSSNSIDSPVILLPFKNSNDKIVNIPLEILKNIYASNGLSAGNSKREALVQGLSECIERGVKNKIIRESLHLPTISINSIEKYGFLEIYNELNRGDYSLILKDCSLGESYPVIGGILINREEGTILSSFGSHPNIKVAIERTITELFQGREMENIEDMLPPSINSSLLCDDSNIEDHFINSTGYLHLNILEDSGDEILWDDNISKAQELDFLKNILRKNSFDFYYRARSINDMWVLQTIIPGLSEIYSVDDLNWDKRNQVKNIRDFIITRDASNIDSINNWLSNNYIDKRESLFKYCGFHALEGSMESMFSFIEFELLIKILSKDYNGAKEILAFEIDESYLYKEKITLYRALEHKLNFMDFDLKILYSNNVSNSIDSILRGNATDILLPEIPKSHYDMLKSYEKFRKAITL